MILAHELTWTRCCNLVLPIKSVLLYFKMLNFKFVYQLSEPFWISGENSKDVNSFLHFRCLIKLLKKDLHVFRARRVHQWFFSSLKKDFSICFFSYLHVAWVGNFHLGGSFPIRKTNKNFFAQNPLHTFCTLSRLDSTEFCILEELTKQGAVLSKRRLKWTMRSCHDHWSWPFKFILGSLKILVLSVPAGL